MRIFKHFAKDEELRTLEKLSLGANLVIYSPRPSHYLYGDSIRWGSVNDTVSTSEEMPTKAFRKKQKTSMPIHTRGGLELP